MRDYDFGNFLRECRVKKQLSQFQLGKLIGVSDKAVSKWENGISKPKASLLSDIARVLEISAEDLLSRIK